MVSTEQRVSDKLTSNISGRRTSDRPSASSTKTGLAASQQAPVPGPPQPVKLRSAPLSSFRIPRHPEATVDIRKQRQEPSHVPPYLRDIPKANKTIPVIGITEQTIRQRCVQRKEIAKKKRRNGSSSSRRKLSVCKPCGKVFENKTSREAHLLSRKHFLKTKFQPIKCPVCDSTFNSPEDWQRHLNSKAHKKAARFHKCSN